MASVALSFALLASVASAQSTVGFAPTPLISQIFPEPSQAPYQVFPFNGKDIFTRGYQTGYNRCNSTTEGEKSLCQTAFLNAPDDFCVWAPEKLSEVGSAEGDAVAYCNKAGHGTRRIPQGAIKGMQFLISPDAIQITGLINGPLLNIPDGDFGGELDSGGQDGRGNPIGSLMYSTAFGNEGGAKQIIRWTEFISFEQVCIKICRNDGKNPAGVCQHTLDRIGTMYNCPSKYTLGGGMQPGEFEVCDSDTFPVPGEYVENGATKSYAQPPESEGAITSIPYVPTSAPTSNCRTFKSEDLFANAPAGPSQSSSSTSTTKSGGSSSTTKSGTGPTPTNGGDNSTVPDAAMSVHVPVIAGIAGVVGAVALLA